MDYRDGNELTFGCWKWVIVMEQQKSMLKNLESACDLVGKARALFDKGYLLAVFIYDGAAYPSIPAI